MDSLLTSEALLDAMRVFPRVFLSGMVLVVLGIVVRLTQSAGSTFKVSAWLRWVGHSCFILGAFLLMTTIARIAYFAIPKAQEKFDIRGDFSENHKLNFLDRRRCATWPNANEIFYNCIYEGSIHFSAELPQQRKISESCRVLWVSAKGEQVDSIKMLTAPLSAQEADEKALTYLKQWQLRPDKLTVWRQQVSAGATPNLDYFFYSFAEQPLVPQLQLSLKHIDHPGNPSRPWFIELRLVWY